MKPSNDAGNADLKLRIRRARAALAFANRCEAEARRMPMLPAMRATIAADAVAVRESANAVLAALRAELKE